MSGNGSEPGIRKKQVPSLSSDWSMADSRQVQQLTGDGGAIQLEAMKRDAELFRSRVLSLVARYDSPEKASKSSAAGAESACSLGLPLPMDGD